MSSFIMLILTYYSNNFIKYISTSTQQKSTLHIKCKVLFTLITFQHYDSVPTFQFSFPLQQVETSILRSQLFAI